MGPVFVTDMFRSCFCCRVILPLLAVAVLAACSRSELEDPRRVTTEAFDGGTFTLYRVDGRCELVTRGEVTQDAVRKLRLILEVLESQACDRRLARLQIDDGSLNAAISMGSMLRNRRFDTLMDPDQACHTACLLVFASGLERAVPASVRNVGFRALANTASSGQRICSDKPTRTQLFTVGRYFMAMLDPAHVQPVLEQLMSVGCADRTTLSAERLKSLGLATVIRGV